MSELQTITFGPAVRMLRGLGFAAATLGVAGGACAADAGLMLDSRLWREEVVAQADGAEDGWYELTVSDSAVQVRSAKPRCGDAGVADDAMYVHLGGTPLLEGLRVNHAFGGFRPTVGQLYPMTLGKTDFAFSVESSGAGTQYVIRYEGETHYYLLGLPAAATQVHAIADLDGDRKPDFVVEVGDEIFLLLSTHARPGMNLPSAQLWAAQ